MRKILIYALLLIFSFVGEALAETTIKAEVDKTSLMLDENLTYKLSVISSEKNIALPELPKFEGFDLISRIQSSSMSLATGAIEMKLSFVFVLAPTDIGKFKIEPSSLKIDRQLYSSESFDIEVKPGKSPPKSKADSALPKNIPPEIESEEPQINL